jgi:chromosome partitioning protein
MKTVSFVSKKGGVAKTTSAIHYAYWIGLQGLKVTLIDDDNNRTASNWAERAEGNAKFIVPFKIASFRSMSKAVEGADYVIIDSQASRTDADLKDFAEDCDLVVIPTKPDINSASAAIETADAISHHKGKYRILITDVPGYNTTGKELAGDLAEQGYLFLKQPIRRSEGVNHASLAGSTLNQLSGNYRLPWRDYEKAFAEMAEIIQPNQ